MIIWWLSHFHGVLTRKKKQKRLFVQSSLALQDSFGSKTLELAETLMTKCFTKRKDLFKQNMLFSGKIFLIISFP